MPTMGAPYTAPATSYIPPTSLFSPVLSLFFVFRTWTIFRMLLACFPLSLLLFYTRFQYIHDPNRFNFFVGVLVVLRLVSWLLLTIHL